MKKEKIYNILKLLICLVFFFSISNITIFIFKIFNIDKTNITLFDNTLYQFIVSLILFILLFILYFNTIKKDFKDFKKNLKTNILYILKLFVIFILLKYMITIISTFIIILLKYDTSNLLSNNQEMVEKYVKAAPFLMFLSMSILGPFYEECIFRLGFKKVINNKWIYIIVSGSLFGLLHVFPLNEGVSLILGIVQSISYVTMGIFFSYIYYKTDNIFISIGLHFLNNFLSVLAMMSML